MSGRRENPSSVARCSAVRPRRRLHVVGVEGAESLAVVALVITVAVTATVSLVLLLFAM